MYIKVSNGSTVMNIDDYALINKLKIYTKNEVTGVRVADLIDGENFYTIQQIHDLLEGKDGLPGYITDKQLLETLKYYILGFEILYIQTDSNTDAPDKNNIDWSTSIPVWDSNKFIWQMIKVERDGTIEYTGPICISGAKGDIGEKGQSLVSIKPQWCLNNDGNWTDEMAIPSEYDELWMRNELTWENPDDTTYTTEVRDQVFEKVKELQSRVVKNEEDIVAINEEIELLKEEDTTIKEELDLRATKEELQEVIDYDNSNLLKNGDFYYGTKHWMVYGTGVNIPRLQSKPEYPHGNAFMIQGEFSHVQYIEQPTYPITNTEESVYTLSCMVQSDDAQDGFDMPLCGLKIEVHYPDKTMEEFISEIEITDGTWNKLHLTIELTKAVEHFECDFYVRDTSKTIRVAEMMFTQGKIVGPFNPSQKEVFDNIYELLENMNSNNSNNNNNDNIDTSKFALVEDIPVKISELEQDIDYLLEIPNEYITEEELKNKNYLTEHQDISQLALKSEIEEIKNEIELTQGPQGEPGPQGPQGEQGIQGETGAAFTYDMFTPEQLEALRGPQGEQGPKGDTGLKGEQGIQGEKGDQGEPGPAGADGKDGAAFTYDMFTEEQLEALRGPQGEQGPIGPKGETGDVPNLEDYVTKDLLSDEINKSNNRISSLEKNIYIQDENGDYIQDENGEYVTTQYASYSEVKNLEKQIEELRAIIEELQNRL